MGNASSHPPRFVCAANDFQLVIEASKHLENILEREFGATGMGLHDKIAVASPWLPPPTVKSLRYIVHVRNALVHDYSVTRLENRAQFVLRLESALEEIQVVLTKRQLDAARRDGTSTGPSTCSVM